MTAEFEDLKKALSDRLFEFETCLKSLEKRIIKLEQAGKKRLDNIELPGKWEIVNE